MVRVGLRSNRMGCRMAPGLKSILNKATPPITTLATTPGDDGAWVTTGRRKTEDYHQKTDVALWMTGREGGEIMVNNNGSCLIPVGTAGLSRTGRLLLRT